MKFTCGLMPDSRPFVDHVYTTYIEYLLKEMRHGRDTPDIDTSLFESLYRESDVSLPGSVLHNQHINYYDHWNDDDEYRPRDTTPVFTPSKLYVFSSMEEDVRLEHRTSEAGITRCRNTVQSEPINDPPECAIRISSPDESLTERLLALCRTISVSQPVTDFCLESGYFVNKYELTEANVPVMSKEAKSLVLYNVDASSTVWRYLLQHESLEVSCLEWTPLPDAAVPLIFNYRNLKVLQLYKIHISYEMVEYVCHHLGDLLHLEEINLSYIDLSRVSSIRLSNTT